MKALTLLLCLAALPAVATEPPDWLAYIPAEQRAALLATRHASPPSALIGSVPPQGYRGPESAAYAAPQPPAQFDASALVGPRRYDLDYHIRQAARVRAMLREYRTPGDGLAACWRVGIHRRADLCGTAGCRWRPNE